jgi:hypothetical protein
LLEDSARRLDSSFEGATEIIQTLMAVKQKEHKGLYRLTRAKPTILRGLFGVSGHEYFEFTTEGVMNPNAFARLEWHCFRKIFEIVEKDPHFKESAEYLTYLKSREEAQSQRHQEFIADYAKFRLMKVAQWARVFRSHEMLMVDKAAEAVDVFLKREVEKLYRQSEKAEVKRRVAEKRHVEQAQHEGAELLCEDVCYWSEDSILDFIFQYYTTSLIDKMLEIPECRKGLLQYSGFLKTQSRHLVVDTTYKAGKEEWFAEFLTNSRKKETGALPTGAVRAVATIHARRARSQAHA